MSKIYIIFNNYSGKLSGKENIHKLLEFPENSMFTIVHFDPTNVKSLVSRLAKKGHTLVVAGGDGTVSSVAEALVELGKEADHLKLGVLPIGTFNHFARDLGIPSILKEALEVIRKGKSIEIDLAKVNNIYFINNSSLGLYPQIVQTRNQIQERGYLKTLALFVASLSVLWKNNSLSIEFDSGNHKVLKTASFVFVGNNKYEISGFSLGRRRKLDDGILTLCIANEVKRSRLIILAWKTIMGRLMEAKDFNVIGLKEFTITSKENPISISHDGQISKLSPPLHYQILPKAISVIVP
jgi:YegS/Rv2252/BmrU family lipid kinase